MEKAVSTSSHKHWFGANPCETGSAQKINKNGSGDADQDFRELDELTNLMRNDSMEEPPPNVTLTVIRMFKARNVARRP